MNYIERISIQKIISSMFVKVVQIRVQTERKGNW